MQNLQNSKSEVPILSQTNISYFKIENKLGVEAFCGLQTQPCLIDDPNQALVSEGKTLIANYPNISLKLVATSPQVQSQIIGLQLGG